MESTKTNHRPENKNKNIDYQSVENQVPTVFKSFCDEPKTIKEVVLYTNINMAKICHYVFTILKENRIAFSYDRKYGATGSLAGSYTTNPDLFPKSSQLKIF
jgi:hypothetical protein